MRTVAYRNRLPVPQKVALPAAQTPPSAARPDLAAAQQLNEVAEACISVEFKAGYNVVLSGVRKRASPAVARPLELDVGHARELAAKDQPTACPRMRPHERVQTARASPCHHN